MPTTGNQPRAYLENRNLRPKASGKFQYRLVVLGAAEVGKTCIITRFLYEEFKSKYVPTIEELHRGEYQIAGVPLTLDILDTSGAFAFPAMRTLNISTGDAFIIVYSVEDESSFEEAKHLRQQIIDEKGAEEMIPIVIVGNKADVGEEQRVVGIELAESTASIDWGHGYVEASAKENTNICSIFTEILRQADIQVANSLSPAVRRRGESQSVRSRGNSSRRGKLIANRKLSKQESCVLS